MSLVQEIVRLAASHFSERNDWYAWRRIRQDFLPPGIQLGDGSEFTQNVELKYRLHDMWLRGGDEARLALAQYYVSVWGGVRRNKPETLARYALEPVESVISRGRKGVSSWSKVLCLRDPQVYAIYDARVAVSLNLLQCGAEPADNELYHMPRGRNGKINAASTKLRERAHAEGWRRLTDQEFYHRYLAVARAAAEELNVELCTVEMLLFACALDLADEASGGQPSAA